MDLNGETDGKGAQARAPRRAVRHAGGIPALHAIPVLAAHLRVRYANGQRWRYSGRSRLLKAIMPAAKQARPIASSTSEASSGSPLPAAISLGRYSEKMEP